MGADDENVVLLPGAYCDRLKLEKFNFKVKTLAETQEVQFEFEFETAEGLYCTALYCSVLFSSVLTDCLLCF